MNDRADDRWEAAAGEWVFAPGVTSLNHGSFGPPPRPVLDERQRWLDELAASPMDFFVRRSEGLLRGVRERLGEFVGTSEENLLLVDNATVGMNVVAASVALQPGDEVLTTDHEYGAVMRVWERKCRQSGARLVVQPLPFPLATPAAVVEALFAGASARTKLIVFSHVTSPTALVLPAEAICRRARELGIAVAIDGPHALAMLHLELEALDCDYYAVSCHKWLSAPIGTGFLYVHPRAQAAIQPVVTSWGKSPCGVSGTWRDEFLWSGTRDPTGYLAVPQAIDLLESLGLDTFRQRTHTLAHEARTMIGKLTGLPPLSPDSPQWYGSMVSLLLPPGEAKPLEEAIWQRCRIAVPIFDWQGRRLVRASCHVYTKRADLERLCAALRELANL